MKLIPILLIAMLTLSSCSLTAPHSYCSNNTKVGNKRGKACSRHVLGIHIGGKAHVYNAARGAKISKIGVIDEQYSGFFPFYYKKCVYVSGD